MPLFLSSFSGMWHAPCSGSSTRLSNWRCLIALSLKTILQLGNVRRRARLHLVLSGDLWGCGSLTLFVFIFLAFLILFLFSFFLLSFSPANYFVLSVRCFCRTGLCFTIDPAVCRRYHCLSRSNLLFPGDYKLPKHIKSNIPQCKAVPEAANTIPPSLYFPTFLFVRGCKTSIMHVAETPASFSAPW